MYTHVHACASANAGALPSSIYLEKRRTALGAPCIGRSAWHCVFMGKPGVGKTKVARFLGKALYKLGAVSSDRFIEVQRRDLVADKVGHVHVHVHAHSHVHVRVRACVAASPS